MQRAIEFWTSSLLIATTAMMGRSQQRNIPPPDRDSFVGQWRANPSKSRPTLSKAEASYQRTIRRDGDDLVFDSSGGSSKARSQQYRLRCDGAFHPLPTGPVLSCRYIAPNKVEGETHDPTQERHYWTREVSADGQEMTISAYKDKGRTKLKSVMVLDRIK